MSTSPTSWVRFALLSMSVAALMCAVACQDRPLGPVALEPSTSRFTLFATATARVDKVDLLFVIDNSNSMADKAPFLGRAVTELVAQLISPPCIEPLGSVVSPPADPRDPCPSGRREMRPFRNVHIGLITTSLGGHGHQTYCESPGSPRGNDRAHLLPTVRDLDIETYRGMGFLAWDGRLEALADPEATRDYSELRKSIHAMVESAGTDGCGFEAPLEAWYRFLVDPAPPASVVQQDGRSMRVGVDHVLLEQRASFLRPDSLLIIVMITDENDCSVRDGGPGWRLGNDALEPGTTRCAEDPYDACCFSCGVEAEVVPAGCPAPNEDPGCSGEPIVAKNIACFDQKRRFGVDFLYPASRYVTALSSSELCPDSTFPDADCSCERALELGAACDPGEPVPNPLFVGSNDPGVWDREPYLVRLVGIVGVPWQDVANSFTVGLERRLRLKGSHELDWDFILGTPGSPIAPMTPPLDTLMQESVAPRVGPPHPVTGIAPAPPESPSRLANPINGHEWLPQNAEDLQYACVFDLGPALEGSVRDCAVIGDQACDCFDASEDLAGVDLRKKPLCQADNGAYATVQHYGKAYPGLRQLEVLRDVGARSAVASLCPMVLDPANPDYGYNPAFDHLVPQHSHGRYEWCLSSRLPIDPDSGHVPCVVVEALPGPRCLPTCSRMPGRGSVDHPKLDTILRRRLAEMGKCGGETGISCGDYCLCEILQLQGRTEGDPLWQCQNLANSIDPGVLGYCYIDPAQGAGDESLVAACPEENGWLIRLVGEETPRNGARTFFGCLWER